VMKQLVVVDRKARGRPRAGSRKEHEFVELSAAAAGLQQISWDGEEEGSRAFELSGGPPSPFARVHAAKSDADLGAPPSIWARSGGRVQISCSVSGRDRRGDRWLRRS
jgi:hypothetical protein